MRLGLSSGARLSAMFASRYPKRVSKLAVLPTGDAAGASGLLAQVLVVGSTNFKLKRLKLRVWPPTFVLKCTYWTSGAVKDGMPANVQMPASPST